MHQWVDPMFSVESKIYFGLHFLIVVPTNLLRLDAPGWTEECKEHSFWSFCCQRTNKLFQKNKQNDHSTHFFFFTQLCMFLEASPATQMTEQQRFSFSPVSHHECFPPADKCPSYNHGRWAGVCHPAQHDWQAAFWPGTLIITNRTCVFKRQARGDYVMCLFR